MFVGGKNIIFFIFISINCYEATLSKAKKKKDTCDKDGCEGVIVKVSTLLLNKTLFKPLFKVNNGNTRKTSKINSKLAIGTSEQRLWCFIVNRNKFHALFWCFFV